MKTRGISCKPATKYELFYVVKRVVSFLAIVILLLSTFKIKTADHIEYLMHKSVLVRKWLWLFQVLHNTELQK